MGEKRLCTICRRAFSVSRTRRILDHRYGRGMYHRLYPQGNACQSCAEVDICYVLYGPAKTLRFTPEEYWG